MRELLIDDDTVTMLTILVNNYSDEMWCAYGCPDLKPYKFLVDHDIWILSNKKLPYYSKYELDKVEEIEAKIAALKEISDNIIL